MTNDYYGQFFDRNGKPTTLKEWSKEFGSKYAFRKEKSTNGFRILTKWTGIDMPEYEWMAQHQFSVRSWKPNGHPKVFVSYVWNEDNLLVYSRRYARIEQAYEAHHKLIEKYEAMEFGSYTPLPTWEELDGESETSVSSINNA